MLAPLNTDTSDKPALYRELAQSLAGLLLGESDVVANAANTASLLFMTLPDVNWVGFYFLRGARELVLGPFQGKPACVRIAVGAGVCGTAVARREAMVVADVHDFPGHIACDVNSRSELVIPLIVDGRCLGVLDLDSPNPGRFDKHDREGAAKIAEIFVAASQWP